ncbi:MAG: type II CRISPR-associated endonuclease Cas1 [Acutalibacteraceae bacterium]
MSWRIVVITKPSKLDYNMGYMAVRDVDTTAKIFIDEISVVVVENTACSFSCALLSQLASKKIKVIFCDEKRNPSSELVPYYGSHDCSQKIKNQIGWSEDAKQNVWTRVVYEKIKNQALTLEHFRLKEYEMLLGYLEELEFNDETNREGHAAKVYFNALFGKAFTRSDDNSINAALNYGYSLILSCFNREVVCNGYLTQLGLFHDNMFNQFNLSCDLMEPFRPIVDYKVKCMSPIKFSKDEKKELLNILNSDVVIDYKNNTVLNAIKIYTKSVFNSIEENDISLLKFPKLNFEL